MRNNTLKRIMSVLLVIIMISCISLSDVYDIYDTFAEESVSSEVSEEFIQTGNISESEPLCPENETIEFEYNSDDFSSKLKMNGKAVFSVDGELLNADDVCFSVTPIEENGECLQYTEGIEDKRYLLLYDIGFYTYDGRKVDVSECDSYITFEFNKMYTANEDRNLSVVKYNEITIETDKGNEISFERSETEITGSTYENDMLKDVTFHVDSFAVYGIFIPEEEDEESVQETTENIIGDVQENAYILAKEEAGNDSSGSSSDNTITINKFDLVLTNGTNKEEDDKRIWVADKPNNGHSFTYRLDFNTSGKGDFPIGSIEIRLPKHILKDKDENYADEIIIPYPYENEEYNDKLVDFVCHEETGEDGKEYIVITNVKTLDSGQMINIPFMYEMTKETWEYKDMAASDPCKAIVTIIRENEEPINQATNPIPVYIDTTVSIRSTTKQFTPATPLNWSDSWGLTKPADADDYYYFTWRVNSSIKNITQKYDFQINDTFPGLISPSDKGNASPEIIGYKMQGNSKYVEPAANGASPVVKNLTAESRTDYVLTRCKKSAFEDYVSYELENSVTATVTPVDRKDAASSATSSVKGVYDNLKPTPPTYNPPGESYRIRKDGIYGNKNIVTSNNNISSYNLECLINGQSLPGLMYFIDASASAYIKTLEDGATGTDQDAIDGKFGKKNVTYSISDSEIYLGNSQTPLSKDDYTFTSLEYSVKMQGATYGQDIKGFTPYNITQYNENDILTFYVMTNDDEPYRMAATYDLSTNTANIADSSISYLTDSFVTFNGNVKGWKIETSNPYYSTAFKIYPTITLNSTDTVRNAIPNTDNAKISLKNDSTLDVVDSSDNTITRTDNGRDYIAKVERKSDISKKVVSTKNYPGIRAYKVNWETSISETYTDDLGINPVKQESGVFYDLIPLGCRVDLSSIKVYADGSSKELLQSEYTIDALEENYKNTNRTLLTVRINSPAVKGKYRITYTTVHLWEDILDFGRYIMNSVAYETGNPDIAGGYADNGGNISDSTIMTDLDPETNDKRFIYSQATHSINALIPISSGISKKVASSNDALFGDRTVVNQNSTYVYKIRMENASHSTSRNIIIFDSLENFCGGKNGSANDRECDWKGTLVSFGLNHLKELGIAPKVYLSSVPDLNLEGAYTADQAGDIHLESDNNWKLIDDFGDISEATAFAIDLSARTDGKIFELGENRSFSFTVTMRSPRTINDTEEPSPETYNNIYRSFISKDTENQSKSKYYDHHDYTAVAYHIAGDMKFQKIDSETGEPIQGVRFNLSGTSFYGTVVDENVTSDANGIVYLADIERGTYLLTETDPTVDYLKGKDRIVEVKADGSVTISPTDGNNEEVSVIENQPRVHGDLTFLKRDYFNPDKPLTGAVFSLTGTSYYGNMIKKTAESTSSGVTFDDVEMGYNYTLKEVSAPDGYITDNREYKVICDASGVLSIPGLSLNSSGDYVITNKPSPSFTLKKVDTVNNDPLPGAAFTLTSESTESGIKINRTVISNQFGEVKFEDLDYGTYHLEEITPPDKHKANKNGYSVDIQLVKNKTVITIIDLDTNKKLESNDDGEFVVSNEREYTGKITIIKKWIGDDENTRPTDPPVIHLSTEEPEYVSYTATINIALLKKNLGTDAVSFQRDTTSSLADIEEKVKNKTAINIGEATGESPKEKAVYLYKDTANNYYYWSEAEKVYLGEDGNGNAAGLFFQNNSASTTSVYKSLATIDISELDTSKVTNFNDAFKGLTALTNLNVGDLKLDSVTNMAGMFYNCTNLTKIDGKFRPAPNVTQINGMFRDCKKLQSVDLSEFETSNALTKTNQMFQNCNALAYIDLSKLNTSNVTDMNNMFYNCNSLTSIDVSNFDTSKVTNISYMFYNCNALTSIDVSNFNTSKVTNISHMFDMCKEITSIKLGENFSLGNAGNAEYMFSACGKLPEIDISSFGTVKSGCSVKGMFKDCKSLKAIWASKTVDFQYTKKDDNYSGTNSGNNQQMFGFKGLDNNLTLLYGGRTYPDADSAGVTHWEYNKASNEYAKIEGGYFSLKPEATESQSQSVKSSDITNVFTPLNNIMMLTDDIEDNSSAGDDSAETGGTVMESYVSTDKNKCKITKNGDTWIYEFNVYDDEALYYVYEEVPEGYISDATINKPKNVNDGSITKRQTITNTKKGEPKPDYGNLTLLKEVTKNGIKVTGDNTVFNFKITLQGNEISNDDTPQYFGAYEFVNGVANITLTADNPITITDIPAGTQYMIEETDVPYGYTSAEHESKNGTITVNTISSVTWENQADNRETGEFHVSKTVELYEITEKLNGTITDPTNIALTDEEKNQEFSFTAELTNLERSKEYIINKNDAEYKKFSSDDSGNATVEFKLKHGERADFKGIPVDATYKISETLVDGYKTTYNLNSGKVTDDSNATIAFTNTKTVTVKETVKTIKITAEKQWENDNEADRPKSITIYLERYLAGFPNNTEIVDTATITPHNSVWNTEFANLPKTDDQGREYVYSVCEESVAGYTCSVALTKTDQTTGDQQFTITNKKDPTFDLTIHKTVEGAFGNKAKQFEFTVTLKDSDNKPLNGFYMLKRDDTENLVLFDVYGQAKIGVSHGEYAVIKNLPEGTQFTVTETDYSKEGYTVKSGLDNTNLTDNSMIVGGSLTSDQTAYFVNSRTGILPTGVDTGVRHLVVPGILSLVVLLFMKWKRYELRNKTTEN